MEERKRILDILHQKAVKEMKYPFFSVKSHQIQIFDSPIDFYLALCKGIRGSYKRIILSSLYIGEGPLERFLIDQLFNRLEVHKSLRLSLLVDYNRGHRGKQFSSLNLLSVLKANLGPNNNVRVGFYRPKSPIIRLANNGINEMSGVQHTKIAIFDDNVFITGANLSENYFTERQDRYFLFKDAQKFADFCDDTVNSLIDCSFQMNDEGILAIPDDYPDLKNRYNKKEFKELTKNRIKVLKYLHNDEKKLEFTSNDVKIDEKLEETQVAYYNEKKDWAKTFRTILKSDDVFNVLKDMPKELNVITGDGG